MLLTIGAHLVTMCASKLIIKCTRSPDASVDGDNATYLVLTYITYKRKYETIISIYVNASIVCACMCATMYYSRLVRNARVGASMALLV